MQTAKSSTAMSASNTVGRRANMGDRTGPPSSVRANTAMVKVESAIVVAARIRFYIASFPIAP
jgi:hypothetical protein